MASTKLKEAIEREAVALMNSPSDSVAHSISQAHEAFTQIARLAATEASTVMFNALLDADDNITTPTDAVAAVLGETNG